MHNVAKIIGIVVVVLLGLIGAVAIGSTVLASSRMNKAYDVAVEAIHIPNDPAALARGEYLVSGICTDCHGPDLAGEAMIEEAGIATIYAPNITPSDAGVGHFSDVDYVRAIRHAVDPDSRGYMIMPAEVFISWSAEDLGATIAYLKSMAPSDNETPPPSLGALGRILFSAGMFGDIIPAAYIDHDRPFTEMPQIGETAEYGAYLASAYYCDMCHGPDMRGGPPPQNQPELGDIPSALHAASWSTEQFITTVTTGVKPDGSQLDGERMPWESIAKINEDELTAVHLYLQSLAE